MGPIARVLWGCLPELLHVGAVLVIVALMAAIMGNSLFGDRAASFSTLAGALPVDKRRDARRCCRHMVDTPDSDNLETCSRSC